MTETEVPKNIVDGEEEEDEYFEEREREDDNEEETEEEEEDEEEEEEEEEEEKKAVPEAPVKQRRCIKRKKIRQLLVEEEIVDEDDNEEYEGEEEQEVGEEVEEELDVVSYTSSVLSAISFVWEDGVYEFEELCDTGRIQGIYRARLYDQPTGYDEDNSLRYLEMCKALNISPMNRFLNSLHEDEVDLSYRNVHGSSIRAMCAALETNNIVSKLILRYNKLNLEDCRYIGLILHYNEKLWYLDFTGCRVGPQGLELLIVYLHENEYVTDLNLSKCDIGDEGMKILSHVLIRNNSIQKLDLSYNKLSEESGEPLALSFKVNTSITHLNLRYNNLFEPTTMKAFFRALTFNNSIAYLDLSWNGLSGDVMGGYISNYIRRSGSIQYLDLSDNRFEGKAVIAIKKGLAKSRTLETLKLGKNPMSPEDLEVLLAGANGSYNLKVLDLEDLWVKKSFLKILKKVQAGKDIQVNYAGVLGDYEVFGPDYPKVILQRAQFEAQKPKSVKKRKDFGHLMWNMGDEPLTHDEFMTRVKKFKAKVNKELYPELIKQYIIPKVNLIDVYAMRQKYLSLFPDSTPPPPPKTKGKKGAAVEVEIAPVQQEVTKEKVAESRMKIKEAQRGDEGQEGVEGEEDYDENDLMIDYEGEEIGELDDVEWGEDGEEFGDDGEWEEEEDGEEDEDEEGDPDDDDDDT